VNAKSDYRGRNGPQGKIDRSDHDAALREEPLHQQHRADGDEGVGARIRRLANVVDLDASIDFKADVAQMIPAGWQPINVVYISTPYDAANVLAVGPLALAQSPQGALQAIYRYQPPGS